MKREAKKFLLRMPDDLYDKLKALAEKNSRSVNGEILNILKNKLK